jgi:hypothetical protein
LIYLNIKESPFKMISKIFLTALSFTQLAYAYPRDSASLHKGIANTEPTDETGKSIVARDLTDLANLNNYADHADVTYFLGVAEGKGAKATKCAKTKRDEAASYSIEATKQAMEWGFPHVGRINAVASGTDQRKIG